MLELAGYCPPWWLSAGTVPGRRATLRVAAQTHDPVPVTLWSPREARRSDQLPLLVVHDGREYDERASITRYSAAMIAAGRLPMHRLALLHPLHRDDWYSASPQYTASLTGPVLGAVRARVATGPVVAMGASLGGLAALVAALAAAMASAPGSPATFAGVFSQSGSFFTPRLDPQESGYAYFSRVTDAVEALKQAVPEVRLRIGLTCGALEENAANNAEMAASLRAAGHRVTYAQVPDLHSFTAWRDALDPHLTAVLQDCWA